MQKWTKVGINLKILKVKYITITKFGRVEIYFYLSSTYLSLCENVNL